MCQPAPGVLTEAAAKITAILEDEATVVQIQGVIAGAAGALIIAVCRPPQLPYPKLPVAMRFPPYHPG